MERRSKMLLATALGATIVVVACSFPDVTYRSDDGDAGSEADTGASEEDTGTDAEPGVEDSGPDGEPPLIEAGLPTDGSIIEDASACEGDDAGLRLCDCDEDGWIIKGCDAGSTSGKKGNDKDGWDCDDHNRDINPRSDFKAVPMADGGWDWNCSGKVEKAYPDGYKCAEGLLCGTLGTNGFSPDMPCGGQGTVYACVAAAILDLTCKNNTQTTSGVQGCR